MSSEFRMNTKWIGADVPRKEDGRLLTGGGRYVDDLPCPEALHGAFLRSPYAHARIESIDVSGALERGAVAAFTAEDMGEACREFPQPVPNPALRPRNILPLARGFARYVGEPVVFVLAGDRAAAEDAGTECVVCLEDARSVAFGCGHLCVCEACAPTVVACPLCREPVRAKQRIYFD